MIPTRIVNKPSAEDALGWKTAMTDPDMSARRYGCDANGHLTRRVELSGTQWITFSQGWDTENRLITVTWSGQAVTFTYDADGVLVRRSQTGQVTQTMLYVGEHYEVNATTGVTTSTYAFGSQRVAMRQGATVTSLPETQRVANENNENRWPRQEGNVLLGATCQIAPARLQRIKRRLAAWISKS